MSDRKREKLRKFQYGVHRFGTMEGLFWASDEELDTLLGREVSFYEVLGKHSHFSFTFDQETLDKTIETIDLPEEMIPLLRNKIEVGINPFHYVEDDAEL